MIKGFKKQTDILTQKEIDIAHYIAPYLKMKIGKKNAVTNKRMILGIQKKYDKKISSSRLRKIINYLRTHSIVEKLVATSNGYYISTSKKETDNYLLSLRQRISAITEIAECLEKQNKNY